MAVQDFLVDINLRGNKLLEAVLNPMTTAQRQALSLTAGHAGYVSYDSTENVFYYWNGTTWSRLNESVLQENFTALLGTDQHVGGVQDQQVIPAGMSALDIVKMILTRTVPPTYAAPASGLFSNVAPGDFEVGEIINPTFGYTFTQNDGGIVTSLGLNKNGVGISTALPYNDMNVQLDGTPVSYQATVLYAQGPCKSNNLGQVDCNGRIAAGSVSTNVITYNSYRKAFYGTPTSTPTTSNQVRSLTPVLNPQENTTVSSSGVPLIPAPVPSFTISIPAGSSRVVFAYPASLRPVASVRYAELSDSEVKGNFSESLFFVDGANASFPTSYRIYTYIPVEPFSMPVTYKIFI